jgi:aminopeptidase N
MLRKTLGEDNWWRAINYYLHKYANQPVETEQFRIAIEESTGQSMDWFFDEWLYKMGHPIFRVTQDYDPMAKTLKLRVEQLQTVDAESQYPQVTLFQTPVEIEIGTTSGMRVERTQILPQKEQTFTFPVDSAPLLVNFDYRGTLIKEVQFEKGTEALVYQLNRDDDVLGRIWALNQLSVRINKETTAEADKKQIAFELAKTVTGDKFWGVRLEAATALANVKDSSSRDALVAATKDPNARVRARAITSLGSSKDPSLASLYQQLFNDPSYAVIRAAASALGDTKSAVAYDALTKLLETPSWRDNIKASALAGLRALQDKRAADVAFRYAEIGNLPQVRAAALRLLGSVGKDNPKTFSVISDTLTRAFDRGDFQLGVASAEALIGLGDHRGLAVFDQLRQSASGSQQMVDMITGFRERLQKATSEAVNPPAAKP